MNISLNYEDMQKGISKAVEKNLVKFGRAAIVDGLCSTFDWENPRRIYKNGRAYIQVKGICPNCDKNFWVTRWNAVKSKAGLCIECYQSRKGKKHPRWKVGRSITGEGYVRIWIGEDHKWACMGDASFRCFEHRIIMADKIGRALTSREHVHHINGVKQDNSPENLELVNAHSHNLLTKMETRIRLLEATLKQHGIEIPEERQKIKVVI